MAALVALSGCAGEQAAPSRFPTRTSLLELHRFTGHEEPTAAIEPGEPGQRSLIRGWGPPVVLPSGRSGALMLEPSAAVAFEAGPAPGDVTLSLSGEPATPAAESLLRAEQPYVLPLGIEVNGVRCRRLRTVTSGQARFAVPAAVQKPGRNLLVLRRPGGHRGRGAFPIPGVTRIELHRTGQLPPRARVVDNRLVLPAGTSITFYLRAPEAARLHFRTPAGGGLPRVTLLVDGAEPRRLAPARGSDGGWEARLAVAPDAPMGIRLEAEEPAALIEPAIMGLASIPPHSSEAVARRVERPNVLLYVMDTLRADRLGCYGYERETSPHLDRFAREGILFRNAVVQAPWTRPSMASIMTGQPPSAHGAVTLRDRLGRNLPTLAESFRAAGYETAGFVTNLNVAAPFGFARGFDRYEHLEEDPTTPDVYVSAGRLHEAAFAWLDRRAGNRPFFLYLHASDVHAPYRPSADMQRRLLGPSVLAPADLEALLERMEERPERLTAADVHTLSALYDAEIATWDAAFGAFWKAMRARGRDADTLVALTADHGEEFHDHGGLEHGHTLYAEQLHVPLVVRLPRGHGGGRTAHHMVQSIDLLPTLGALTSPSMPGETPGMPIVREDGAIAPRAPDPAFASTQFGRRPVDAIVLPPWKVIVPPPGARRGPEVYDIARDPGEHHDVAARHPVLVGYACQQIAAASMHMPALVPATNEPPVDPAVMDRLRSLGYVVD